jgi:hypothetical protein
VAVDINGSIDHPIFSVGWVGRNKPYTKYITGQKSLRFLACFHSINDHRYGYSLKRSTEVVSERAN